MKTVSNLSLKKAQSIVEYCLIMIFVMVAIMSMGPYVLQSWNATVKTLEDSANETAEEEEMIIDVSGMNPGF